MVPSILVSRNLFVFIVLCWVTRFGTSKKKMYQHRSTDFPLLFCIRIAFFIFFYFKMVFQEIRTCSKDLYGMSFVTFHSDIKAVCDPWTTFGGWIPTQPSHEIVSPPLLSGLLCLTFYQLIYLFGIYIRLPQFAYEC